MTKKIAVQLFGHLRTFEKTYDSFFEHVVNPQINSGYSIDIFIHTWSYLNNFDGTNGATKTPPPAVDETIKNRVIEIYKPKKIMVEEQKNFNDNDNDSIIIPSGKFNRLYNMHYTVYQANNLRKEYEKENNINYDYVIQTRPDILFDVDFDIEMILKRSKEMKMTLPQELQKYDYINNIPLFTACSIFYPGPICLYPSAVGAIDICYFSTPEIINKVTELFIHMDDRIKQKYYNLEHFFISYLKDCDIDVQAIPFIEGREYKILRYENLKFAQPRERERGKLRFPKGCLAALFHLKN